MKTNVTFCPMPTDGADFGRTRPCYGKAYIMAREGAADADVAECIMRGVEPDIRRDGGAPSFCPAVELLMLATASCSRSQILDGVDMIQRDFMDFSLTRHFASATEKVGLSAINEGRALSRQEASERLLVQFAESRCCDSVVGYAARYSAETTAANEQPKDSINSHLSQTAAVRDLAERMQRCSPKGLPARAAKVEPVSHTADGLNEEL